MRERLRQLGGVLNIHSNARGTLVTADLPLAEFNSKVSLS
jgi:signal transduction histidine kinase